MMPTRILVAEDESLIRLDLVEMLGELGYDVVAQVGDGQSAVDRAGELRPDVCFLDVAMPVRDGLSAAEEIIASRFSAVVMVTAFSQQDMIARAASAGVMGYLVKPFTKADLAPAIEMASARWQQMRDLEGEIDDLSDRVAARDIVERAKARLQSELAISESEAFALLRRQAMDSRVTLAEISARVLQET
jgi:response regulator NasT